MSAVQHKKAESNGNLASRKSEGAEPDHPVAKTVPGYAGRPESAPAKNVEKPEGAVLGESNSLTLPTEVNVSAESYKKPSNAKLFVGQALLEGDTFNGFHRKVIVQLDSAVTQEGAYNVFHSHYPDSIREGFKVKLVDDEEAVALRKQWREEGAIPGQPPSPAPEGARALPRGKE